MKRLLFLIPILFSLKADAAISKASLSARCVAKLTVAAGSILDASKLQAFCDAISEAIVQEIQANAVVSGSVTSGPGAGGGVTGTVQ